MLACLRTTIIALKLKNVVIKFFHIENEKHISMLYDDDDDDVVGNNPFLQVGFTCIPLAIHKTRTATCNLSSFLFSLHRSSADEILYCDVCRVVVWYATHPTLSSPILR